MDLKSVYNIFLSTDFVKSLSISHQFFTIFSWKDRIMLSVWGIAFTLNVSYLLRALWDPHHHLQCPELFTRLPTYQTLDLVQVPYSLMTLSSPFSPTPAANVGDYQDPPQSVQNQASHSVSNFVDGSGPISQCIWKWRRKRTRRWLRTGKRTPTGSLYLCVSTF